MESIKQPNPENAKEPEENNQWDTLLDNKVISDKEFFSKEASATRMNKYLDTINADDFMSVIRGYRKHLDDFQQKFSEDQFKEKYDNNPDLLNVYAFSTLVKDYLSKKLDIAGVDLNIKQKDYNNTEGGHIDIKEGKIYINFDYNKHGTLSDVTKTMAHEMWHAKQALSSFESDNEEATTTPYFKALFIEYKKPGSDEYRNQAVEREARDFADAFERKIYSDNPSYNAWMQEKYGLPSEYYGQLATRDYFDSLNDWYDDEEWYDED